MKTCETNLTLAG